MIHITDLPGWIDEASLILSDNRKNDLKKLAKSWKTLSLELNQLSQTECAFVIFNELTTRARPRREFLERPLARMVVLKRTEMWNDINKLFQEDV